MPGVRGSLGVCFSVRIKPPAAFLPQPAHLHVPAKQRAGSEFWVAQVLMQHLANGEDRVQTDPIGERQRADRMIGPGRHREIDGVRRRDPFLQQEDRFVDHRHEDAVDDEARRVLGDHRHLAQSRDERQRSIHRLVGCLPAAHDLHQFHDRRGVHEVKSDHPVRSA